MRGPSPFFVSAMLVGPLAFLYIYFVSWAFSVGALPPTNIVGTVILASLIVRLAVVFSIRRLRRGSASLLVNVFAADILAMVGLFALYLGTANPVYTYILQVLVPTWPAAVLLVIPPLVFYRVVAGVFEGASISSVAPSAIGLFSLFSFIAETATLKVVSLDLAGISKLLFAVVVGEQTATSFVREITFTGILLYVGLTFYSVAEPGRTTDRQAPLVLAIAGGATALAWVYFATSLSSDLLLVLGLPGLGTLAGIWLKTRAR